ncbi:MAG: DUF1905 domain-containing protein [Bacteroidota bacterium]
MIQFKSEIILYHQLKMNVIVIPADVLTQLNDGNEKGKFNKRVIIKVNQQVEWQGGIVALSDGDGYITISKERMKKLHLETGDEVELQLRTDNSEFGHEFPAELSELFLQEPTIEQRFRAMSLGKQRTLIYYINQPKSSEKRAERAILYMNNLMQLAVGKESFKEIFKKN